MRDCHTPQQFSVRRADCGSCSFETSGTPGACPIPFSKDEKISEYALRIATQKSDGGFVRRRTLGPVAPTEAGINRI